jgi:HEAT repeat protein
LADASEHPDARVRAAALGAVVRAGAAQQALPLWRRAVTDSDATVRRRAAELAPELARRSARRARVCSRALVALLDDPDVTVLEAAAWAIGELGDRAASGPGDDAGRAQAVAALSRVGTGHRDALAREAAVAALGALGDPAGLPAVLSACADRPAVRRRAVLALAPFSGRDVEAALQRALEDHDWQVRQAAEDLLSG